MLNRAIVRGHEEFKGTSLKGKWVPRMCTLLTLALKGHQQL